VSSRRIILVNRYFHPDHSATSQLATDLAVHLASQGWDVIAIAGRQRYEEADARLLKRDVVEGVRIRRSWSTRFGRNRLAGRAIDYLTFAISAFALLLRLADRRTIVIAMTDPPMLSVVAAAATTLRGARLVNWLQDLFPEVAEALGVTRRNALLHALRDWSLRRAVVNVAVGERMAERVRALGTRAVVLHNWADAAIRPIPHEENLLRKAWGLEGTFVVAYSGNLGRAHDIDTIAAAIRELEGEERIRFLFIGGGARTDELRRATAGATNVQFEPYQPRERLSESLSAADVHLISLDPRVEGLVVPSKTYGVLAVGRPAILIGDSGGEITRLLRENQCGLVVEWGDDRALSDAIRRLAADPASCVKTGERGRALQESRFAKAGALDQWKAITGSVSE
jgi:colanic acid biosynthesis glycosyl transferase WcaI